MIEVIAVIRDIAIILGFIILVGVAIVVLKVVLDLAQKAEDVRLHARAVVAGVMNPVKGGLLILRRLAERRRA